MYLNPVDLIIAALIVIGFLTGIRLIQNPRTAMWGNRLGALSMLLAILFTFHQAKIWGNSTVWLLLGTGAVLGLLLGGRVKMIAMPQTVALLNGLGGASSAVVAGAAAIIYSGVELAVLLTIPLALAIGSMTLSGSIIAAGKLNGLFPQKPLIFTYHSFILAVLLAGGAALILLSLFLAPAFYLLLGSIAAVFTLYGVLMALRIGGADMPIIIAFLNSFSGIAAAICGLAVNNLLLAGVGSLVGVAGMILTRIMCRAMNRSLPAVLGGFKTRHIPGAATAVEREAPQEVTDPAAAIATFLKEVETVTVIPGYGMAVSQAQQAVKELIDSLEQAGKTVKVAIHPVAGRMPGHMNVLLAEVGIPYEKLFDIEVINPTFPETDLVIAVGACDVINPAANTAEGTPIYGMPILDAARARKIIICNLDQAPGYSGVDNTLYHEGHVVTFWGNAAETVPQITALVNSVEKE